MNNLFSYFYIPLFLFIIVIDSHAQRKKEYIKAVAQSGDGIYTLLGRYNIGHSDCSFKQFCKVNGLTSKSYLKVGRTYKLPIIKYRYNQKSIRTTIGIKDWRQAKQIERYNDIMVDLGRKTSGNFRKGKRELWVPYHLKYCHKTVEKFVPKNRNFPILGSKYSNVPLKDTKLAGAVYYLVSGHGGPDPGAIAKYKGKQLCEDEYAYDITLRLARNLLKHGAIVYIITRDKNDGIRNGEYLPCDVDERCWDNQVIPIDQKARLTQRSDVINKLYLQNKNRGIEYQRVIAVHVDSRKKDKRIDLFFYHHPNSLMGKQLSQKLQKVMKDKYAVNRKSGEYHGEVIARDLHMVREVLPVPIFIEVGNIQNKNDQKRIMYASNRQALADWIAEGLLKDY